MIATAAGLLAGSPGQGPGSTGPAAGAAPATAPAAAPAAATAPAPAPACSAEPDRADAAAVAAMLEALRRLPPRRSAGGEAVVTLDNRGFGYAQPPDPFAIPTGR